MEKKKNKVAKEPRKCSRHQKTRMAMLTTILNVPMASDSDASKVRSQLDSLRGIFDISVDKSSSKVTIDHDSSISTSAQLRDSLRLAGYNASVLSPTGLGSGDVKVAVPSSSSCCDHGHDHGHSHAHGHGEGECNHEAATAKKGDACCGHDHSHSHGHGGWGCNIL